ncbi:MAG: AbrB/MazE/SpoVT family DNA-binding domain-containing protein [Candidatus Saganbacteria bacterium]|nr:AbrB/MazE/SpoVT family DNA-binding domain-containing protein [Candidatus Saganbacteria bacterium]
MAEATLSSKYQLVIPKEVREETGLKSGERLVILAKDGIINIIPKHLLKRMKGFVKGIKLKGYREDKDRL